MSDSRERPAAPGVPGEIVGPAIQRLAAARLGRAFLPLGVLLLVGLSGMLDGRDRGTGPFLLAVGAPASAGALLAYGMGIVQRAFRRPRRAWWLLANAGGLVPLTFGVYLFGWRGLRVIAQWNGVLDVLTGVAFAILGFWTLRDWQKLSELETLAAVMTLGESAEGRPRGPIEAGREREGKEGGS